MPNPASKGGVVRAELGAEVLGRREVWQCGYREKGNMAGGLMTTPSVGFLVESCLSLRHNKEVGTFIHQPIHSDHDHLNSVSETKAIWLKKYFMKAAPWNKLGLGLFTLSHYLLKLHH